MIPATPYEIADGMKMTSLTIPLTTFVALALSLAWGNVHAQTASHQSERARYGAIALGGNGFGATRDRNDADSAAAGAIAQCEESGGAGECRVRLAYRNQCAAMAMGDDRFVGVAYADTIAKAQKSAQRSCSGATGQCRLVYAACSFPVAPDE